MGSQQPQQLQPTRCSSSQLSTLTASAHVLPSRPQVDAEHTLFGGCEGTGGAGGNVQSEQSLPKEHSAYSAPGPPSSQAPSSAWRHESHPDSLLGGIDITVEAMTKPSSMSPRTSFFQDSPLAFKAFGSATRALAYHVTCADTTERFESRRSAGAPSAGGSCRLWFEGGCGGILLSVASCCRLLSSEGTTFMST